MDKIFIWIAFFLPKRLVEACGWRLLHNYAEGKELSISKLKALRFVTVMNKWENDRRNKH